MDRERHTLVLSAIMAAVCCALPLHPAQARVCCEVSLTNDGFLALRTGPGAQFPLLRQIPSGDAVCFGSKNPTHPNTGDWVYGSHTDTFGQKHDGWVHGLYLDDNCD